MTHVLSLWSNTLRSSILMAVMVCMPAFSYAKASVEQNPDAVEVSSEQGSSREEVAAIQVLSEICPNIIGASKNFSRGYQVLLNEYLPGFNDPELALKALNETQEYQKALQQARDDASKATREYNREVCLGVVDLSKSASKR